MLKQHSHANAPIHSGVACRVNIQHELQAELWLDEPMSTNVHLILKGLEIPLVSMDEIVMQPRPVAVRNRVQVRTRGNSIVILHNEAVPAEGRAVNRSVLVEDLKVYPEHLSDPKLLSLSKPPKDVESSLPANSCNKLIQGGCGPA